MLGLLVREPLSGYDLKRRMGERVGFFWQVEYIWAPVIENLIGDIHDSGGVALTTGVLGGF